MVGHQCRMKTKRKDNDISRNVPDKIWSEDNVADYDWKNTKLNELLRRHHLDRLHNLVPSHLPKTCLQPQSGPSLLSYSLVSWTAPTLLPLSLPKMSLSRLSWFAEQVYQDWIQPGPACWRMQKRTDRAAKRTQNPGKEIRTGRTAPGAWRVPLALSREPWHTTTRNDVRTFFRNLHTRSIWELMVVVETEERRKPRKEMYLVFFRCSTPRSENRDHR